MRPLLGVYMKRFCLALSQRLANPRIRRIVAITALGILIGWFVTGIVGLPGHWVFSLLVGMMIWVNTIKLLIERSR